MRTWIALAVALLVTACSGSVDGEDSVDTGDVDGVGEPVMRSVAKGDEVSPGDCGAGAEALVGTALGAGAVEIVHQCAWMNCCTDIDVGLEVVGGVVELTEIETGEGCFCEGFFSPTFQVEGLGAGEVEFHLGDLAVAVAVL